MTTRQIAHDIWLVEQKTARKTTYVGMIRLIKGKYITVRNSILSSPFDTLEEAEAFFEA